MCWFALTNMVRAGIKIVPPPMPMPLMIPDRKPDIIATIN